MGRNLRLKVEKNEWPSLYIVFKKLNSNLLSSQTLSLSLFLLKLILASKGLEGR